MAEIATLTAVFTADLSQFEIGIGKATALMSGASAQIGADLATISANSLAMSQAMIGSLAPVADALNKLGQQVMALKNAIASLGSVGSGVMMTASTPSNATTIQGGTFVFQGVQDVNGLYDALNDVARQRSPL